MKKRLYWALFTILMFASCTMQKRVYSSGFHIDWSSRKENTHADNSLKRVNYWTTTLTKNSAATEIVSVSVPITSEITQFETSKQSNTEDAIATSQPFSIERATVPKNTADYQLPSQKTQNKKHTTKKQLTRRNRPGDGLVDVILLILGIIAAFLGYDSYNYGWGGRGSNFDWTVFFTVVGVCFAGLGFLLTAVGGASMSPSSLKGMMGAFTFFTTIFSGIGLIKSIRDYNDVCKFVSIGAFALLAIMWIVGLLM